MALLMRKLLPPLVLLELCWLLLWLRLDVFVDVWAYQGLFAAAFAAYIWALAVLLRGVPELSAARQALLVLVPAILFRLTLLPAEIAYSDDIFRYVWNGRVSAADIDPYRYLVDDPALEGLRDERIWPHIGNRAQASPYPPLLESWFALIYRIYPESLTAMKLAMSLLDVGVIGLLLLLLHLRGAPLGRAAIYAWSPQAVFQVAFSGHNEPLLLFWILVALVLGERPLAPQPALPLGRRGLLNWDVQTRRMLGGFALGMATLAKLVPVLVLPILFRRWGWRACAVYSLTVGAVYGALLLRGNQLFRGIAIETTESQFNDGLYYPIYLLAEQLSPSDPHALALLAVRALLLAIILLLTLRPGDDMAGPIGVVLASYVLLAASVAPWYVLWVLPFVCLDALPTPLAGRAYRERLFGGYWLAFSWTAAFSELYYLGSRGVWLAAHLLEYLIPAGNLALSWLRWGRLRASRRYAPEPASD
jgi:alpha-1,6-mannosyltransferase